MNANPVILRELMEALEAFAADKRRRDGRRAMKRFAAGADIKDGRSIRRQMRQSLFIDLQPHPQIRNRSSR
jgi:hypothetical protein